MFTKDMSKGLRGVVAAIATFALALLGFSYFAMVRPASAEAATRAGKGIGGGGAAPGQVHNPATQAWFGEYEIPGVGGFGFCIDPGRAAPGQLLGGGFPNYNQPGGWHESMSGWLPAGDADTLTNAILAYNHKSIGDEGNRGMNDNEWAAATSIVAHQFGHTPGGGKKSLEGLISEFMWQANYDQAGKDRVAKLARDMNHAARQPGKRVAPNSHLQISTPKGGGGSYQVMIMVNVVETPTPPPPPPPPPVPPTVHVPDKPTVALEKMDNKGNPLGGAVFAITNERGDVMAKVTSDDQPGPQEVLVDFDGNDVKDNSIVMYIEEIEPPKGYIKWKHPKTGEERVPINLAPGAESVVKIANSPDEDEPPANRPKIGTTAKLKDGNLIKKGAVVTDAVKYSGLKDGQKYTLKGELVCNEGGEKGKPTGDTATKEFTAAAGGKGSVNVDFTITNDSCWKQTVFQTVVDANGNEVAKHRDINSVEQTFGEKKPTTPPSTPPKKTPPTPSIGTKARLNGDNVIKAGSVVTDTVSYKNLTPGKEYTLTGELMCTETGKSTGATATKKFTPKQADGTVDVEIKVKDTNCLTQTVFETLKLDGKIVAEHKDIKDKGQTVGVPRPEIGTKAKLNGGDNVISEGDTVTDTVSYSDLTPGKEYTLTGELMCTETGESTGATATKKFTPKEPNGTVDVEIKVKDTNCLTQTVFETLKLDGKIVAEHKDINDGGQTVGAPRPEIGTKAQLDNDDNVIAEGSVVTDTVTYRNLTPGKEYTLTGELMCTETGESTGATATKKFTPKEPNGTVDVEIKVKDTNCLTQTVFETLKLDGKIVAEHKDINDEGQTVGVRVPKIGTKAQLNNETNTIEKGSVVTDTVSYTGLTPGKEYTLAGELMCTETGESTGATASARFTPENPDGRVQLQIPVNNDALDCEIQTVFETLYLDGKVVAEHKDINDDAQTVGQIIPKEIGTKAELNGGDNVISEGDTVTDTVSYTGLTPGKEYRLSGELFCTATEESTGATAETTFVPEERNGTVTLEIPVKDTSCATQTVFETLFDTEGNVVATHHDITDVAQTVGQPAPPKPAPKRERVVVVKIPSGIGAEGDTTNK